jgi:hypothetical protein
MPLGFVLLLIGGMTATLAGLFAIAYGISMGLSSIVRGTVPLQLFGPVGFGAMMGKLSAPGLVVKAAAPLAFAVLIERAGADVGDAPADGPVGARGRARCSCWRATAASRQVGPVRAVRTRATSAGPRPASAWPGHRPPRS